MKVIFEKSQPGRQGVTLPDSDVPVPPEWPAHLRRGTDAPLCELSELDVIRHFAALAKHNFGVDSGFYPLGSCTMKYNPKVFDRIAALDGFAALHPGLPQIPGAGVNAVQGALAVLAELEAQLCEIGGMDAFTLQPLAGAHGELTGLLIIAAHFQARGEARGEVLIPDEAHGTNPASAAIAGFTTRAVPTDASTGMLDLAALRERISDKTAAVMVTNPNTLGIFNRHLAEVVDIAHTAGAQVYYDGANLNAVLGRFRPGDAGVDVMHVNLHKTFATPHGGGGPGSGPVGVRAHLKPFLPSPRIVRDSGGRLDLIETGEDSIGRVAPFFGNFLVCLKACIYIRLHGAEGLKAVSDHAVLNANYLMQRLKPFFSLPYDQLCKHEFVLSAAREGSPLKAMDVAKALIDAGVHPPTVNFPLIVREALMIEPTETESLETLDAFVEAMQQVAERAAHAPQEFATLPETTAVSRPDEVLAARQPDLAFPIK